MDSITHFLAGILTLGQEMSFWHSFLAILVAYLGGVLSSLTPCVYPMIPITVSVVGGLGSERRSWKSVFLRGLAYVSGMMVVYSFLGVLAGMSGKVFGSFTNTTAWYFGLSVVMSISALVMLDVIGIDFTLHWERFLARVRLGTPSSQPQAQSTEMTWVGAFVLGASSGFIAAPCTTPVLTAILAFIAQSQSVVLGFFLMMAFSLGLGTLLLLIAIFAGALQILPKSGRWMEAVKKLGGLILLCFGEYLMYQAGRLGGS